MANHKRHPPANSEPIDPVFTESVARQRICTCSHGHIPCDYCRQSGYVVKRPSRLFAAVGKIFGIQHKRVQSNSAAITPALIVPTATTHSAEKRHMLNLINDERGKAGAPAVALGDNIASQVHAETALENYFTGHWGVDGLKAYMRYSLAGGYQANAENMTGLNYCVTESDDFSAIDIMPDISKAMTGLMNSPGHRENILNKWHCKVSIGLAWDNFNIRVVQHFEGDYVEYDQLPAITNGALSLSGRTKNGARFVRDFAVDIQYDPPPHPLTWGQIARTYNSGLGRRVASVIPRALAGYSYNDNEQVYTAVRESYLDPYDIPADTPGPRSYSEAHKLAEAARYVSQSLPTRYETVPYITAAQWKTSGESFSVSADVIEILNRHGPGVYTVCVSGTIGSAALPISQYSIFHNVTPPAAYYSANLTIR